MVRRFWGSWRPCARTHALRLEAPRDTHRGTTWLSHPGGGCRKTSAGPHVVLRERQRESGGVSTKADVLLADEAPIWELDELRQLITDGQERGVLTFEQIASTLEEVEVTKEQVQDLHAHLVEQG